MLNEPSDITDREWCVLLVFAKTCRSKFYWCASCALHAYWITLQVWHPSYFILSIISRKTLFYYFWINSWTRLIWTRLFRILHYFELITISFGSLLHLFTIGYFKLLLLWTIFRFPCEFEIAGFNCIHCTYFSCRIVYTTCHLFKFRTCSFVWCV